MILPLALILCCMASCQDKAAMAELEEQNEASVLPGFIFSEPAPSSDGKIKILLHFDMEGLSGQDDWTAQHAARLKLRRPNLGSGNIVVRVGQRLITAPDPGGRGQHAERGKAPGQHRECLGK